MIFDIYVHIFTRLVMLNLISNLIHELFGHSFGQLLLSLRRSMVIHYLHIFMLHTHGFVVPHTLLWWHTARSLLHSWLESVILLTHSWNHVFKMFILSFEVINLLLIALALATTWHRSSWVISGVLTGPLHVIIVWIVSVCWPWIIVSPSFTAHTLKWPSTRDWSWSCEWHK